MIVFSAFLLMVINMIVGFDYGSSNCAMGVVNNEQVELAELDDGKSYLPSALYAQHPALIANYVAKNLRHEDFEKYRHSRSHILINSICTDRHARFFSI